MIREEPFPVVRRGTMTKRDWATKIMECYWRAGYPELLGRAEEQVTIARRELNRDNGRKAASEKKP